MKIKNLFYGAVGVVALAMTVTSCSNDDVVANNEDKVGVYMSLQVVGPKSTTTTRTMAGYDQTEQGTEAQNKISSLLVLLCDKTTHQVVEAHSLTSSDLLATTDGVTTKVRLTTKTGSYDVYAVANPPQGQTYAIGTDMTGQTIENVTEQLMQTQYAKDNQFIMFNECNGSDDLGGANIEITAANDYDNPAHSDVIYLDRLAVQIRSKAETVSTSDITASYAFLTGATLESYKLLNGATKVNLQQKWSNTLAENGNGFPWINLLQTPAMREGTNAGNDADYYNHLTNFRTINMENGNYTVVKDLYETIASYGTSSSIFCMENHPEEALLGNTTGLVYKFKSTVTGSDNKAGNGCFYGYNDKYFATLAALQAAYPHAFDLASGTSTAEKLAAAEEELSTAYASADKQTEISKFRVKYSVKVYTDGIMYYTYFIKDKNYKNAADGKSYYSVMRNTIYDLTVTNLLRIGTDIPGGWTPDKDEPTDPVEPNNVYMVVEAKVNNWVLSIENNIELE